MDTEGCLLSPNYPQNYSNNQRCTIIVNQTLAQPIRVVDWDVEYWQLVLLGLETANSGKGGNGGTI